MHYTRIHVYENSDSRFEMVHSPLIDNRFMGSISIWFETKTLMFWENKVNYDWAFHNAPARQFIIPLNGEVEITASLGDAMRFCGGEIVFLEDTTVAGYKTENIVQYIRKSLFITL
ncbi:cupin domain-containing protein [Lacibacter sediminis]|uniref:DUF861 domain-containing protein n=1 Tax=Lacibacter sediminis TaxID=2760713 RepID=A0A7G5XK73_9BACT|nr:hypothetical protein [Lacibacter sediminis]QNA45876.1 hypothetical protein H4075_06705 [Lacibacter sediminis]